MLPLFNSSMCVELETNGSFVDRVHELELCVNSILANEKAIVLGERGTGKSALIKRVQHEIENYHNGILPIYMRFSPEVCNSNSHIRYIYNLLITLIKYIWVNILGYKLSSLFDDDNEFQNELTNQTRKIHRLARISTQHETILRQREAKAAFFVEGRINKSLQHADSLNPLSNQEIIGLFSELCDALINHAGVKTLVFLCDEANLLDDIIQLEIERELSNIFPALSCSFLYVESVSAFNQCNPHTDYFEQIPHSK